MFLQTQSDLLLTIFKAFYLVQIKEDLNLQEPFK